MNTHSKRRNSSLTEAQIECLRMVAMHKTSKEIARELGISPYTVDQRLDLAREKLEVATRKQAAIKFIQLENIDLSERFVYEQPSLGTSGSSQHPKIPTSDGRYFEAFAQIATQPTKNENFVSSRFDKIKSVPIFGVPPIGGVRHDMTHRQILTNMFHIAFFSALSVGLVTVLIMSVARLLD